MFKDQGNTWISKVEYWRKCHGMKKISLSFSENKKTLYFPPFVFSKLCPFLQTLHFPYTAPSLLQIPIFYPTFYLIHTGIRSQILTKFD